MHCNSLLAGAQNNTNFCKADEEQMLWERGDFSRPLPAPSPDLRLTFLHSHEFCSILMPEDSWSYMHKAHSTTIYCLTLHS